MALPTVNTLAECSSWDLTVAPYIPQLYDLPQKVFQSWNNPNELYHLYMATNPLIFAFALSLFLAPVFLLVSEFNRNYSQVDRCWSILPTIYNAHFALYAHWAGLETKKIDQLLAASIIWSLRLSYNYWRKGGYNIGSEDYRWEVLRKYISPPLFFIFNVVFISLIQSLLLFSITTPTYIILLSQKAGGSFGITDTIFSRLILGLVLITYVADQQQWDYQETKRLYRLTAKVPKGSKFSPLDLDRGFLTQGLWSRSRHPNFAAEQAIWVVLYQWGCLSSDVLYNWTLVGPMCYLILFQGSTWFTEWITARKYPDYKEYQRRVGKFLPRLVGGGLPGDFSDQRENPAEERVEGNSNGNAKKVGKK